MSHVFSFFCQYTHEFSRFYLQHTKRNNIFLVFLLKVFTLLKTLNAIFMSLLCLSTLTSLSLFRCSSGEMLAIFHAMWNKMQTSSIHLTLAILRKQCRSRLEKNSCDIITLSAIFNSDFLKPDMWCERMNAWQSKENCEHWNFRIEGRGGA